MQIKIPKRFYDDHLERELPAPDIIVATQKQYTIDTEHKDYPELLDDAKYYADDHGPDCCPNIKRAAKALLEAIKERSAQ